MPLAPLMVLLTLGVLALAAPLLTPYGPNDSALGSRLVPPVWIEGGTYAHILGTDTFGRDVLTRLLFGIRTSLSVVALSLLISGTVGASVGVVAAFRGGWVDSFLMRLTDIALSVPPILLALAVAVAVGPSFRNVVLILGFLVWPHIARLVRAEAIIVARKEYVTYATISGLSRWYVLLRHVVPNVLPTLVVAATLETATVIMTEASLGFLGAGIPPPQASWGAMIREGIALVNTGWWIALLPGVAIVVTVLSFNALGDWLRDHLDPATRRRSP